MSRLVIAVLLSATTVRAAEPVDFRPKETLAPGAAIVELHRFATLEQFRHDLRTIDRRGRLELPEVPRGAIGVGSAHDSQTTVDRRRPLLGRRRF